MEIKGKTGEVNVRGEDRPVRGVFGDFDRNSDGLWVETSIGQTWIPRDAIIRVVVFDDIVVFDDEEEELALPEPYRER